MTGRELVCGLQRAGFSERRRSRTFVWLARDEQVVMVDEETTLPDDMLEKLLGSDPRSQPVPMRERFSSSPSEFPGAV